MRRTRDDEIHKLKEVSLPNIRKNRHSYNPNRKLSGSFGTEEYWEFLRKVNNKMGKKTMTRKQFSIITDRMNKAIVHALGQGYRYYPPCFPKFEIFIKPFKKKIKFDKYTGEIDKRSIPGVNWGKTQKLWEENPKAKENREVILNTPKEVLIYVVTFERKPTKMTYVNRHVKLYLHFKEASAVRSELERRRSSGTLFQDLTREEAEKIYGEYKRTTE